MEGVSEGSDEGMGDSAIEGVVSWLLLVVADGEVGRISLFRLFLRWGGYVTGPFSLELSEDVCGSSPSVGSLLVSFTCNELITY